MEIDFSHDEIQLLTGYSFLFPQTRSDLKEYLHFLLNKQYKAELLNSIVDNGLFWQMLKNIMQMVERNDFDRLVIKRKVRQLKELYFGVFTATYTKYSEVVPELDCYDLVKDFGVLGFENIERALALENNTMIQIEIADFYKGFEALAKKKIKNKNRLMAI